MSKSFREDLTGKRFGKLTVLEFVPDDRDGSYWKCMCDCGKVRIVKGHSLKFGFTKSCGCLIIPPTRLKHEMCNTRICRIWYGIRSRCYSQKNPAYGRYGGRGITMCEEWKNDFMSFYNWAMKNGYQDNLTIDRIDVNGNYEPNNCRWADAKTQSNNRRSNILVEYQNEQMTLTKASEKSGISFSALIHRYHRGDRGERLFRK